VNVPDPGSGLEIEQDLPLKPYTSFKIGGPARFFCRVSTPEQIREAMVLARAQSLPVFVLGGGSNILMSDGGFGGVVIHPGHAGVRTAAEDLARGAAVRITASAGEPWDKLVGYTVDRGWWGIENLSHIPGQSGAALVQNVGAYGQQLSDVFEQAEVLELATGEVRAPGAAECGLGYRRSIFNSTRRGQYLIWSITMRLTMAAKPQLNYRDVQQYFAERGISGPSQQEIRQAIIHIRNGKFPYPREERGGNAGSFFKNPTLDPAAWGRLQSRMAARFGDEGRSRLAGLARREDLSGSGADRPVRVPAAMLIDLCGLPGFELGRAQVNPSQPLVILNQGGATAADVLRLAGHVRRTVNRETGILLEVEPELVGFKGDEVEHYFALG
jgi:UDP-N-acetylmuramate dehydrogenase